MKISGCETIGNTEGKIRSAIEKLRPKGGNVTILCANKACNITWTAYTTDFKQNNAVYSITFDDHGETQNNFVCHPLQP